MGPQISIEMIFFIQANPMRRDTSGDAEQDVAHRRAAERDHVLGVRHPHEGTEAHRQEAEDHGRHLPFGGETGDVSAEALAVDHRVGHGEEQLRQVAADLPLDADGHDGPGEVGLAMRSDTASMASSTSRPRRASVMTRRSSLPMGSSTSFDTASTPWRSE
jgi:hypothetical protein